MRFLKRLFPERLGRDERGATAIEYGLLAAMIAIAMLAAISRLGFTLTGVFERIASALGG